MILFLAGFFLIYTMLHVYAFWRLQGALGFGPLTALPLAFVMLAMISAPMVIRLSENAGFDLFARFAAYSGYTWMGLLFLFVCMSITIDVYRLMVYVIGWVLGVDTAWLIPSPKFYCLFVLGAVALIGIYGSFEARDIKTERISIVTDKIPAQASPLRIAQISDIHLGLTVRQERLKRIMRQVERADPDILVSTGDLVDGQMDNLTPLVDLLQRVSPKYGKFAVTGNHEFYAGIDQAIAFTRRAGFRVLRGEAVTVDGIIDIVGVDDPAGPGFGVPDAEEKRLLENATAHSTQFVLFLKHRPVVQRESLGRFDLQLSGHLHKGQVFPFRLITRIFFPFIAGFYSFPGHSLLYVSRGSGTWGPPIRFLASPEVTVIELVHGTPSGKR